MPSLLEPAGRLLLHLREAEHGLTEAELALRAGEDVGEILSAYLAAGLLQRGEDRYHTVPERRPEMDAWLTAELQQLGKGDRLYFAYGSNLDPDRMYRGPAAGARNARFLCRARLPGHLLAFNHYSPRQGWVAGVVRGGGAGVWGVLYLLDDEAWQALDRAEGVPDAYRRVKATVQVRLARREEVLSVAAQVYSPSVDSVETDAPTQSYMKHILDGAQAFGLPEAYQEFLEGIETVPATPAAVPTPVPAQPRADGGRHRKYQPLVDYLSSQGEATKVPLTFAELEAILGFPLEPSARNHAAWWSPSGNHTGAGLWAESGWRATPRLSKSEVEFHRQWNEGTFLREAERRLAPVERDLIVRLHEWAKARGPVEYGRGLYAAFTAHLRQPKSVFTANTKGHVQLNFGWLIRALPVERVEALRQRLLALPGAGELGGAVQADVESFPALPLGTLREPADWELFTAAVLEL